MYQEQSRIGTITISVLLAGLGGNHFFREHTPMDTLLCQARTHHLSMDQSCRTVERTLRLPEVPVEALVDAAEEVGGGVDEAGRRHRPGGDAADEGVAGGQLLPVLAVEGRPGVPPAVVWHLYAQRHVLRQYQRPEGQGVGTDRREKDPGDLWMNHGSSGC